MTRSTFLFASIALMIGSAAHASDDTTVTPNQLEVRPFIGAFMPTGTEHDHLKNSLMSGAQIGYSLPIPLQLVGTFAWTPNREKGFTDSRTNVYQYDAGVELAHHGSRYLSFSPFVGAGLGARTYSLGKSSHGQTDFDGYGSLGGQVGTERLGGRLEVRDYLSRFKGFDGLEKSSTRNDVMIVGALSFRI